MEPLSINCANIPTNTPGKVLGIFVSASFSEPREEGRYLKVNVSLSSESKKYSESWDKCRAIIEDEINSHFEKMAFSTIELINLCPSGGLLVWDRIGNYSFPK